MEADGFNPDQEKPTHSWLRDHDFRPLLYALREYHDMTFGEFWSTDLGLNAEATGYDWSNDTDDDADTPCLATEHVRALYQAADGPEDRLLVLALCAWGLRPNEVARLHTRQFVLDVDNRPESVVVRTSSNARGRNADTSFIWLIQALRQMDHRLRFRSPLTTVDDNPANRRIVFVASFFDLATDIASNECFS
jgi:hypothetical protein